MALNRENGNTSTYAYGYTTRKSIANNRNRIVNYEYLKKKNYIV